MQAYTTGSEPIPGYRLARFLGQGSYGQVWAASGPGGIDIALKILSVMGTRGGKELRAIGLVKKLRHPNLIPLYGYWIKDEFGNTVDGAAIEGVSLRGEVTELIIAMGLGDKSLAVRLAECKKEGSPGIPIEELLRYMDGAAKAIDYLNRPVHMLGSGQPQAVSHCDIKPGNLLVVGNDVQLCDYGLARAITPDIRATAATGTGTQAYSSPEMLANRPSDYSDQYSLAISYYELRTGQLPFPENEALHAHIQGRLDFGLVIPAEQAILKRATQLEPDQRFPNASEFLVGLREANRISGAAGSGSLSGTPAAPPATPAGNFDDLLRPGGLIMEHELVKLIGRGGYGEVWEARTSGGVRGLACALKIVRNLDGMQGKQEQRSLELVQELEHEGLIRLRNYWLLARDGTRVPFDQKDPPPGREPFALVMATDLAVKNLLQYWQEFQNQGRSNIPVADLMRITRQSADAIDYLNERDITHRDIKPENILLSKEMRVKISDFGLAKLLEGSGAAIHQASVGLTLAYAAPELFDNRVTRWTDQYALAITYYRLRTGNFPFPNDYGPRQMMLAHTEGRLEFAGVRPEEERVLRKATAQDPQTRYPNCVSMVEALEQAHGLSASQMGITSSTKPSDFKIPTIDKSRPASRGDDPRRTLVQDFTGGPPKTDSHTEPFLGGPAVTVATDSQVMAELVESASVKETPRSNNDLQVTVIPQVMPLIAKPERKPHRAMPTPNVDEILQESKAAWWKRVGILGGGTATAVALVIIGYLKFFSPGPSPTTSTPDSGASAKLTPVDVGDAKKKDEPVVPPVVRKKEDELRTRVNQKLDAKQFAEATGEVIRARQDKLDAAVTDELDGRILTRWRTHAIALDPTARIAAVTQALAAYPSASPRAANEALRLDLADDLCEAQVEQRLRERDFVGATKMIETALGEKRIRLPRAERVKQTLSNRWIVAVREQMDAAGQQSDPSQRIAALGRVLDGLPANALVSADLRTLRAEIVHTKADVEVGQFRERKEFAKASAIVQSTRAAGESGDWADQRDEQIKSDWRSAAEGKGSVNERIEEFNRLLAVYSNDAIAKSERDRLKEGAAVTVSSESIHKFRSILKELTSKNLANKRGELRALLANKTNPAALQRQIQTLLARLDEYDKDEQLPPNQATLESLATKYDQAFRASAEELRPLAPLYLELCERVSAALVKSVGEKTDWSKLEAATRKLKTPWSDALHAEAVTEKLSANLSVPAADRTLPTGEATGDVRAYRDYIKAARDNDAAAAMRLVPSETAPIWSSPYRFARLLRILQEAADGLKQGGTLAAPFTDAETAYRMLSAAERFATRATMALPKEQLARIRLDLGLAALTKPQPDLAAGRRNFDLVDDEAVKALRPVDEIQFRVLSARTRDPFKPAERTAAIRGEIRIFDLLREHNLAGVPIAYLDAEIIGPLERDGGKAIIGVPQSPEDKVQSARLFCEAGRHLLRFSNEWEREKAAAGRPLDLAVQFLDCAVVLEPRAEYLAWRGLLRSETTKPDMALAKKDAEAALVADKTWSGGHTLSGIIAAMSGRNASDVAQRIVECTSADQQFQTAEKLAMARPDGRDELVLLYKAASANDVLLANFISDPKLRVACLDRAIARADKLLALDPSRLDMCDTKGCALEDKAWLLQSPDRFGESGAYRLALAEFTKALGGINPRAVAQMHRGRTMFKLAEDRRNTDKTLKPDELNEMLAESRSDLTEALTKSGESNEGLEAHFWKAKIELLRLQQPLTPVQQEQAYIAAASEFKEAKRIAEGIGNSMWAEPITFEWAMAALQELRRAAAQSSDSIQSKQRLKEASELAEAAKKYSKPWNAYLRMLLLPYERTGPKNKTYYDDLASRADDGLGESRQQDRRVQFLIRLLRAENRSLLDVIVDAVKPAQALDDAEAALKIAKEVPLSADDQANAYGMIGLARIRSYLQLTGEKKEAAREKPREDFRRALQLAPNHYMAWQWKAFLGMIAKKEPMKTTEEFAQYTAEAYHLYREAEEAMPKAPAKGTHDEFVADHVRQSRDLLEKKFRTTLETGLKEKPDHPDRVLWQLSLAEMQARAGDAAAARAILAALSSEARKTHDAQVRRIELALKK